MAAMVKLLSFFFIKKKQLQRLKMATEYRVISTIYSEIIGAITAVISYAMTPKPIPKLL
jgi:hypothetical protein